MSALDQVIRDLEEAAALARVGGSGPDVWQHLEGWHTPDVGPWARAVTAVQQLSGQVGTESADLLDSLAASAAAAQESADAREAALAGPRATAKTLMWLPLVGLGLGVVIGARPWQVIVDGGIGTVISVAGLVLMLAGQAWSRLMIDRAIPSGDLDSLLAVDLCAAALRAGLPLPAALSAAGRSGAGPTAAAFTAAGQALASGQAWSQAWPEDRPGNPLKRHRRQGERFRPDSPPAAAITQAAKQALALAWESGVAAGPLLSGVALRQRRLDRRLATVAAGKLGVQLMMPLGLCFLPAFMALGLVPVVISLASGLNLGF